jgi:hypothetical protein
MNWIFNCTKSWSREGYAPAQLVLLRAATQDEEGKAVISNIIELNVFAMDFFFGLPNNPLNAPKYQQIYYEELIKKDFFLEELSIAETEPHLLKKVVLYLKCDKFDKQELLFWVQTCLSIWGFSQAEFVEKDMMAFAETNPLLSMFSIENVKKMEDKLGKEWWKQKE